MGDAELPPVTDTLAFNETMSGGEGFSFDYAAATGIAATPLPASWTMMLIGIVAFGFVAYRRKLKPALALN